METKAKWIVVTGANKGIGFGVVDALCRKPKWNIIMACRNLQLAAKSKEILLKKHPHACVEVEQLDVSSSPSIRKFTDALSLKYNKVDVLVNNAGIYTSRSDGFSDILATVTNKLIQNFYGTIELSEAMLPLLNDHGKIITLGSQMGKYSALGNNASWLAKFQNPYITKEELIGYMREFEDAARANTLAKKGFTSSAYSMSKLGINVYTMRILVNRQDVKDRHIQVYAQCPGWVKTDMTNHAGMLTVEQGAKTTVFLAELPFEVDQRYQGQFFQRCALSSL